MKNCAIIGWEEGLAGQVSEWLKYNVKYIIYPFKNFPKPNLKKIKSKPSKKFEFPQNGRYLNKKFVCSNKWVKFLKGKKIKSVLVLVSDRYLRLKLINEAKKSKIKVLNAIHNSAIIMKSANIGDGVIIEPLAYIGYKVEIEDGVLIQERASVEHGSVIRKGSTLNPGVMALGNCLVGENTIIHSSTFNLGKLNYIM